jgi:hypothetical protein
MRKVHRFGLTTLVFALVVCTSCGNPQGGTPRGGTPKGEDRAAQKGNDDHDHGPGPHGGTVIDFGRWHAEFTVNHKAQEATVYMLSTRGNKPTPIRVEKLLLSIKSPQFQVELRPSPQEGDPEDKSSRFVGKHEHFGKEQEFEGTLSGVVDGKPYAADFKEEEPRDHKHEKK